MPSSDSNGRDGDFGGGLLLELIELAIDLGLGGRIDHVGEVVDAAGRLRKRLRGRDDARQEHIEAHDRHSSAFLHHWHL